MAKKKTWYVHISMYNQGEGNIKYIGVRVHDPDNIFQIAGGWVHEDAKDVDVRCSVTSSSVPGYHTVYEREIHISWSSTKSEKDMKAIVVKEGSRYMLTTLSHFCESGFKEFFGVGMEKVPVPAEV